MNWSKTVRIFLMDSCLIVPFMVTERTEWSVSHTLWLSHCLHHHFLSSFYTLQHVKCWVLASAWSRVLVPLADEFTWSWPSVDEILFSLERRSANEVFIYVYRYLIGEEGYCLTSMQSALTYVESLLLGGAPPPVAKPTWRR